MKKVNYFISKYSWLLKLGIFLVFLFWAMQLGSAIYHDAQKGDGVPAVVMMDRYRIVKNDIRLFSDRINAQARAKGNEYGPREYFNDLRIIDQEADREIGKYKKIFHDEAIKKQNLFSEYQLGCINILQEIFMHNMKKTNSSFDGDDFKREKDSFDKWVDDNQTSWLNDNNERMSKEELLISFKKTIDWLSVLYVRGIFVVLGLFLLRMKERRGILVTILSDKKKFFLALILWPLFLTKYPANVVREIIVEAELRRIGKFFRKLTVDERKLVEQVAQSKGFFRWIKNFHLENVHLFERSFVMALLAIIIVNFIYAGESKANEIDLSRDGPHIQAEFSLDKDNHADSELRVLDNSVNCLVFIGEKIQEVFCNISNRAMVIFEEKMFHQKLFIKNIEHIPIC